MTDTTFRTWMCMQCGWIYSEAKGDLLEGLEPGTLWSDVPADWKCPACGSGKADFDMVEL